MSERKWKRVRGGWELWAGPFMEAICEPAADRGCWWWTTWGLGDDEGGYAFNFAAAKSKAVAAVRRFYDAK